MAETEEQLFPTNGHVAPRTRSKLKRNGTCGNNCTICGTGAFVSEFGIETLEHQTEILSLWKIQCAKSLCDSLFECEFPTQFREYFENGNYCPFCLQIIRDINFAWKQMEECKRQIEEQSTYVCTLLSNYHKSRVKNKPEPFVRRTSKRKRISLNGDSINTYSNENDILEMILDSVSLSKLPPINDSNNSLAMDHTELTELLEYPTVKEEFLESEFTNDYDDNFDVGGMDWHTDEPSADKNTLKTPVVLERKRRKKGKKKNSYETVLPKLLKIQSQTNAIDETNLDQDLPKDAQKTNNEIRERENLLVKTEKPETVPKIEIYEDDPPEDFDTCTSNEVDPRGSDSEPPQKVTNLTINTEQNLDQDLSTDGKETNNQIREGGNSFVKTEKPEKVRKIEIYEDDPSEDSESTSDEVDPRDSDWEPPQKVTKLTINTEQNGLLVPVKQEYFMETTDEDSNNEELFESIPKEKKLKKSYCAVEELQSDISLNDSEHMILQNLLKLKLDRQFSLTQLEESELAFVKKLHKYSAASIRRLKEGKKQSKTLLELKARFRRREAKGKRIRYNTKRKLFCCTTEGCDEKFKKEEILEAHVRKKHEGEELPFYCTTCPRRFSSYIKVQSHRRKTHNGIKLLYLHFCKVCHKGFKTEEEFRSHLESAHRGPNPFACSFCGKQCTTSVELIQHTSEDHVTWPENVTNVLKLRCDKCKKYFSSKDKLEKHSKEHETQKGTEVSIFNCGQCNKSFSSKNAADTHARNRHSSIVCEICGKSVTRHFFNNHINRHNKILKYECLLCGKRYVSLGQLRDHERKHSGIRTFFCPLCGKGFFTKTILTGHEKIHEPGYVPRKPFRRTKPNRKKKVQEQIKEIPESEPRNDISTVSTSQSELLFDHRNMHINNSTIVPLLQTQFISYDIIDPPDVLFQNYL